MKARRLPGVRCSTLNTECKSLLCLMIMPGRSWVAGIDIGGLHLLHSARNSEQRGRSGVPGELLFARRVEVAGASAALGVDISFYTGKEHCGNWGGRYRPYPGHAAKPRIGNGSSAGSGILDGFSIPGYKSQITNAGFGARIEIIWRVLCALAITRVRKIPPEQPSPFC